MHSNSLSSDDTPALRTLFSDRSWPDVSLPPPSTLQGKTVLVSGAGGSLGQRLVRTLCRFPVGRILALDASEHMLVRLQSRLRDRISKGDGVLPSVQYILGDLRLPTDRRRALSCEPDIVIHAAAYKHVPFLEDRPIAAVENNLLATIDWAQDCREAGVDRFVFVSTDKAVAPTSVMGRTKQLGEQWFRGSRSAMGGSNEHAPPSTTVRLCNLFGSRGSVVPRFLRRLEAEAPLPVTHPDMHRWFMAPTDASQAVVWALTVPPGTYVPTSCLYVSIPTLARRMIQWAWPETDPDDWIRWVGCRPGERLQEQLWGGGEESLPTDVSSLRRVETPLDTSSLPERVACLREACAEGETEVVHRLLKRRAEEGESEEASPRPEVRDY